MASLVTDGMLSTVAVFGTPDQCAAQIVERYGADVFRICAYFPGDDPSDEPLAEFAPAVVTASS